MNELTVRDVMAQLAECDPNALVVFRDWEIDGFRPVRAVKQTLARQDRQAIGLAYVESSPMAGLVLTKVVTLANATTVGRTMVAPPEPPIEEQVKSVVRSEYELDPDVPIETWQNDENWYASWVEMPWETIVRVDVASQSCTFMDSRPA